MKHGSEMKTLSVRVTQFSLKEVTCCCCCCCDICEKWQIANNFLTLLLQLLDWTSSAYIFVTNSSAVIVVAVMIVVITVYSGTCLCLCVCMRVLEKQQQQFGAYGR